MTKQLKVIFTGTVQGVGFRASAQQLAQNYPITGYVRNLFNGKVELVAEGEETELQNFLNTLRHSHLSDYIRTVMTEWGEARGEFADFRITR